VVSRPSPAVQDYLKAIYQLADESGGGAPITTSQVAEALIVTTASASNMLKRLDRLGYVRQIKRQGVALTDAGRAAALEVIRHHRLLETYLATRLGMSWDEVHREAEVLEHHVSVALADRIAEELGHPAHDPHGDPIPTLGGEIAAVPTRPLSELPAGSAGEVSRVSDRDEALLRFLADLGLVPAARVEVLALRPFGGPMSVRVAGKDTVEVPPEAARAVRVAAHARAPDAPAPAAEG
jgi:DtxR family Mn-dependent transcriptional regulator